MNRICPNGGCNHWHMHGWCNCDEVITMHASPPRRRTEADRLKEENDRLKEENRRLRMEALLAYPTIIPLSPGDI